MKIEGGFYLKARCIKSSWIAHSAPVLRETWDYLLREANHSPKKYKGFMLKRGQLFRTYTEIREALSWNVGYCKKFYSANQMKHTMNLLTNHSMIQLTNQPRGVLITICNYDYYQTPKNYESTNESTNNQPMNQPTINRTSTTINKNEKNEKNEKNKNICGEPEKNSDSPLPVISIPLIKRDGEFSIYQADIDQWQDTFPGVKVLPVLKIIKQWNTDNPDRRKTSRGIRSHISRWLAKEQNTSKQPIATTTSRDELIRRCMAGELDPPSFGGSE